MSVSFCSQKPTTWWSLAPTKKKNILIFLSLSNIIYKLQSTKQVAKNQVNTKTHTGLTSTTVLHPNLTNFPLILCLLLLRLSSSESESDSLIKFDTQSTSSNHIIKPFFFFFFNLIFNIKSKNTNPTTYFYFLKKYIYFFIFNNRKDTLILYLSDPHKATTLKCFSLLSLLLQNLTLKFSLSFLFKNRDWFLNKFLSVGPYDLIDNIYH